MDAAFFFILPTVGGYLLAHIWNFTKFRSSREEGHRLYFRAVFFGTLLFAIVWVATQTLRLPWPAYTQFEGSVVVYLKPLVVDHNSNGAPLSETEVNKSVLIVITALYALLLGWLAGCPLNLFFGSNAFLQERFTTIKFASINLFNLEAYETFQKHRPNVSRQKSKKKAQIRNHRK